MKVYVILKCILNEDQEVFMIVNSWNTAAQVIQNQPKQERVSYHTEEYEVKENA